MISNKAKKVTSRLRINVPSFLAFPYIVWILVHHIRLHHGLKQNLRRDA